ATQIAALGGNYWDNLYAIGHQGNRWIGTYESYQYVIEYGGNGLPIPRGRVSGDGPVGALISKTFTVEHDYITLLVSGGSPQTINLGDPQHFPLYVPPRTVLSNTAITLAVALQIKEGEQWIDQQYAYGKNSEIFDRWQWDVRELRGREARIAIVDNATGPWGHINVDDIVFTDTPNLTTYQYGRRSFVRDSTRDAPPAVWGFVDAHTHPMNHLAFGGEGRLFWGTPVGEVDVALRACDGYHANAVSAIEIAGRR